MTTKVTSHDAQQRKIISGLKRNDADQLAVAARLDWSVKYYKRPRGIVQSEKILVAAVKIVVRMAAESWQTSRKREGQK